MPNYLTPAEVARRMKASPASVRSWLLQGRFPGAIPPNKHWRIPEEAIDQFIKPDHVGRPRTKSTNDVS